MTTSYGTVLATAGHSITPGGYVSDLVDQRKLLLCMATDSSFRQCDIAYNVKRNEFAAVHT